jgi:NAD(P)-dependent dehydrogenase (short-subunit alcohol dehydrogenase family)
MVLLVGGVENMREVVEAKYLPALPPHSNEHLKGKTVVITGANRGYGRAAAQHFLEAGAKVTILCRSGIPQVAKELQNITSVDKSMIEMLKVDMSRFGSIETAVQDLYQKGVHIDYLVLNAATVGSEPRKDSFGVGQMFTVNYLGNVVLVNELKRRSLLKGENDPRPSRILVIGSGSYREGRKEWFGAYDDWNIMQAMQYYGQTKFLLATWVNGLRTGGAGKPDSWFGQPMTTVTHSPGPIDTDMGSDSVPAVLYPTYKLMKHLFFLSPYEASAPLLYLSGKQALNGKLDRTPPPFNLIILPRH